MAKTFPVGFNFRAFENISRTLDKMGSKFNGLKNKVTQVNNKFAIAKKRTEAFRRSLGKLGSRMKSAGRTLSTFVTLPLLALGAAAVKVSSDAEETANKFDEVFKTVGEGVKKASISVSNYLLSSQCYLSCLL